MLVHSGGVRDSDFTLRIALTGGAGALVEDDRHGRWLQDGSFDVEEHEIEPCAGSEAPVDA